MKNLISFITIPLMAFLFMCTWTGCSSDSGSDSDIIVYMNDEDVMTVFSLTNSFRTGNEAVYVNQDNSINTTLLGQLGTLTLDEGLCRAAAVRAKEIVGKFSHTRPNGSGCSTVLNELGLSLSFSGENIAAGNKSGERTFLQWKEDDENYDGQGHRRNMLNQNSTKIGIAYAYDASSTYKYYWVMILAR